VAENWISFCGEVGALIGGHVRERGVLAALERADVGGDGPAVGDGDAIGVGIHHAVAVRDDVEEMADGRIAEALLVVGRRRRKTAAHDDAATVAVAAVADRAVDVETLAAALEEFARQWDGKLGRERAVADSRRENIAGGRGAAGDGVRGRRLRGGVFREMRRRLKRARVGLMVHVIAGGENEEGEKRGEAARDPPCGGTKTNKLRNRPAPCGQVLPAIAKKQRQPRVTH